MVEGDSSSGKSALVQKVLDMFPEERWMLQDSMSDKSFSYMEDKLKNVILFISEKSGLNSESESVWNDVRQIITGGSLRRAIVQDGKLVQKDMEGPTVVCMTTTGTLEPETDNRLIKIASDGSPPVTKRVIKARFYRAAHPQEYRPQDHSEWHALHRCLALSNTKVIFPFGDDVGDLVSDQLPIMRRISGHLIALVMSHAQMHQANREVDSDGYIVATEEDYEAVCKLFVPSMAISVDDNVKPVIRQTVEAVEAIRLSPTEPVTINQLTEYMGLNKSNVNRRVREALKEGYLSSDNRRGTAYKLVVGRPLPTGDVLPFPSVEQVVLATGEEVLV